jgi:hypothetical protein
VAPVPLPLAVRVVEVVPAPEAQMLVLPLTEGAEGLAFCVTVVVAEVVEQPEEVLVMITL